MIKILHVSDIHIGMTNYGRLDPQTGINTRILDFLRGLDFVVERAIKERVDLFLFTGDAFKTRDPSPTEQREFAKRIKRVAKAGIPVLLLVGNHDLPNALGKANSLEIYKTLEVENVVVAGKPELLTLDLAKGKKLQVGCLPWMSQDQILPEKNELKDKSTENVHRLIREKLIGEIKRQESQLVKNIPAIFAAHTTIAGAEFGGSKRVFIWSTVNLPLDVFSNSRFGYVALGHLHKYQVLNEKPPVLYAGSIDRVDFGEEKEDKGFVMVELENNSASYRFCKVPARRFVALRVKISEDIEDPTKYIIDRLAEIDLTDVVLKIILELTEETDEKIDEREIRRRAQEAYFFAGIEKNFRKIDRQGKFDYLESLSTLEILEKYLTEKKITKGRKEKILELAKELIKQNNDSQ